MTTQTVVYLTQVALVIPMGWYITRINKAANINLYINGFNFSLAISLLIRALRLLGPLSPTLVALSTTYIPIVSSLFTILWLVELSIKLKK